MDEQATFETRAVLTPRRPRLARLVLALPVLALAAVAWTGLSSRHDDRSVAVAPDAIASIEPLPSATAPAPEPAFPSEVIGLGVRPLDDVLQLSLTGDDVVAVAGWYVPTAITDCPRTEIAQPLGLIRSTDHQPDPRSFCDRSGALFDSRPPDGDGSIAPALPVIATRLVHGVEVPPQLEDVGAAARQVVFLGRLVPGVPGCERVDGCSRELVVDHVAWVSGA